MSTAITTAAGGFEGRNETGIEKHEVGAVSAMAREKAELEGAMVIARKFPRDEATAYESLMKSCARPAFAEESMYCFDRGGAQVKGPSINMAKESARVWGNIRSGVRIVSADDDWIHIVGFAFDLQTNTFASGEDKFRALIYRKKGGWIKPDERDLRELVNRRGAIVRRNAILDLIPTDIVSEAMRTADDTMVKAAKGEIKQDHAGAVRRVIMAFNGVYVSAEMLAKHIGHPLDTLNEQELVALRQIYKSIKDGHTRREEHFDLGGGAGGDDEEPGGSKAAKLASELGARFGEPEQKPEQPKAPAPVVAPVVAPAPTSAPPPDPKPVMRTS